MLVEVALPLPLPRTFTYRIDRPRGEPGTRVRVPFSGRRLVGWVVGEANGPRELKRCAMSTACSTSEPSVPPDVLELCRWIADYYLTPLGVVLRGALPAVLSDIGRTDPPEPDAARAAHRRELPTCSPVTRRSARAPPARVLRSARVDGRRAPRSRT
jgi:primosomal protein N' (replication factor Y) (superfamily II helicase)